MKKALLLIAVSISLAGNAFGQTPWVPWALALDSSMTVSQLNLALDSVGFTLAAPGTLPATREPVLLASVSASPWIPMDLTGLDSSITAIKSWHKFNPANDIIVALDSAGNHSYHTHDIAGTIVALDSVWKSSFQVHNFLGVDSMTFACGMDASNSHPTIITSVDSGATWSPLSSSLPFALDSGFTSLVGMGSTMAVMAVDSLTLLPVFLTSTDAGATWNAPSSTFPGGSTVNGLALDSLGNFFACGHDASGAGIWQSTDGGSTWTPLDLTGIDLDSSITAIAMVGYKLVAAGVDSLGRSQVYKTSLVTSTSDVLQDDLGLTVSPNPSNGVIRVSTTNGSGEPCSLMLTDLQGRVILQQKMEGQQLQAGMEFGNEHLANGMYLLQLTLSNRSYATRVVISR